MKKFLLLSLLSLCLSATASAKSLVLLLEDGTKVYYLLGGDTNPLMKVVDGEVYVNADKYAFSGINKFYISTEDDPNGIGGVEAEGKSVAPVMQDGVLYVNTTGAVSVYTLDGRATGAEVSSVNGGVAVNVDALPKGVYILKVGKNSVKFMKN